MLPAEISAKAEPQRQRGGQRLEGLISLEPIHPRIKRSVRTQSLRSIYAFFEVFNDRPTIRGQPAPQIRKRIETPCDWWFPHSHNESLFQDR